MKCSRSLNCLFGSTIAALVIVALFAIQPAHAGDRSVSGKSFYSTLNCGQLWRERNAIFARQGYCFKDPRAVAVFGKGCRPPFGKLQAQHKAVLAEISSWERSRGCN